MPSERQKKDQTI